ncbi:hypothetical protein [Streptosporangium sp. CA-115845]|uniref:hypothetical protein n=1 Tax=Streptosporangium sp. CA-115845 TaxID=3240071 RepID=UPI003D94EDC4
MITMNTRIRRMSLLSAAALVALAPSAAFADPQPEVPTAQAFDGDKPLPSTSQVTERCAANPGNCRFQIDPAASQEYYSAVKSLGNAVINCTQDPIEMTRMITLQTGSTDNLGGEITGNISVEGQINASGEVSAGVNAEGHGNFDTPNKAQGPSAQVGAKGGATGSGKLGGSLGVKGAFEGAFKLHYQRGWTREHTESTTYKAVVRHGDALVFGASAAMQRVAGKLTVGGGLLVRDVVVDGPSTVNTSTFVANTFTVPGNTCDRLRPPGRTGTGGAPRLAHSTGLWAVPVLPQGSRLKKHTVLTAERS